MEENDFIITCSRCGAEMKSSARYCMKCGNLNPNHPENESMLNFLPKSQGYVVGSGKSLDGHLNGSGNFVRSFGNNTGNSTLCFYVNLICYILLIVLSFLVFYVKNNAFNENMFTSFAIFTLIFSFMFLFVYSFEKLFMKMNKKWWYSLIPIYNTMIMAEAVFKNKWLGLLSLVPGINGIFMIILYYKLGKKFEKSGFLTVVFLVLMIPIIGLGDSLFEGRNYVEFGTNNPLEKKYKLNKIFISLIIFFIFVSCIIIVYFNYDFFEEKANNFNSWYYLYATDKMVEDVKDKIKDSNNLECGDVSYNGQDGVYYFYYSDVGDELELHLSWYFNPISAYVKVVILNGEKTYYVSMSDGSLGFDETKYNDIDSSIIKKYEKIDESFQDYSCE